MKKFFVVFCLISLAGCIATLEQANARLERERLARVNIGNPACLFTEIEKWKIANSSHFLVVCPRGEVRIVQVYNHPEGSPSVTSYEMFPPPAVRRVVSGGVPSE